MPTTTALSTKKPEYFTGPHYIGLSLQWREIFGPLRQTQHGMSRVRYSGRVVRFPKRR